MYDILKSVEFPRMMFLKQNEITNIVILNLIKGMSFRPNLIQYKIVHIYIF